MAGQNSFPQAKQPCSWYNRKLNSLYKLRSPPKLVGAPLYMGFLYGVKIARLDDYMGFLYGAPPDLTVHFWAQKTQNNVSQKAQMLLQKIVTDSLPPPRFTASTTTLVSLPGRKPVLTTLLDLFKSALLPNQKFWPISELRPPMQKLFSRGY